MDIFGITSLGQAGFRVQLGRKVLFIDPYLSNSVEEIEGPMLRRLRPAPYVAGEIRDADYVLISHSHMDHCDAETLLPLSIASTGCHFIGPKPVTSYLKLRGIAAARLTTADRLTLDIEPGISIIPVPAAHKLVEQEHDGSLRYLGYVICWQGKRILHTGDTCVHDALIHRVRACGPIDIALLPVNECNYFRDRVGIVGNMSIREAFKLAEEVEAKVVVPMHYDMFELNQAYREEIEIIYQKTKPKFRLVLDPENL